MTELRRDEVDPIQPVSTSHYVDEIFEEERLVERYNYIVYVFENDDGYMTARTYLDEIEKVAIYGPFADEDEAAEVSAPALEAAVLEYLKRRFQRIERLNPDENAPDGFETVWSRSARE